MSEMCERTPAEPGFYWVWDDDGTDAGDWAMARLLIHPDDSYELLTIPDGCHGTKRWVRNQEDAAWYGPFDDVWIGPRLWNGPLQHPERL